MEDVEQRILKAAGRWRTVIFELLRVAHDREVTFGTGYAIAAKDGCRVAIKYRPDKTIDRVSMHLPPEEKEVA